MSVSHFINLFQCEEIIRSIELLLDKHENYRKINSDIETDEILCYSDESRDMQNNTNNNQPCFHCKPGDNTNGSSEMDELVRHEANDHENQLNEIVKSTKFRQQRNCIITRF